MCSWTQRHIQNYKGPQDYGKDLRPGSSAIHAQDRSPQKGLQLSDQAAKLRHWRRQPLLSRTSELRHHTPPKVNEATGGTEMIREKKGKVENLKLRSPQRNA